MVLYQNVNERNHVGDIHAVKLIVSPCFCVLLLNWKNVLNTKIRNTQINVLYCNVRKSPFHIVAKGVIPSATEL